MTLRNPNLAMVYTLAVLLLFAVNARADGIIGSGLSGFAVLGGSPVTNTGASTISGDVDTQVLR